MKVMHLMYRRGSITETEKRNLELQCIPDTFSFLGDNKFLLERQGKGSEAQWKINSVLNSFINQLEGNVGAFPPTDFLFQFPVNDRYPDPPEIFIAMPYGPDWFEPVKTAIETAIRSAHYAPQIGNDIAKPGFVMNQVWTQIRRAAAIISDGRVANAIPRGRTIGGIRAGSRERRAW
jgi:hypothetical protein